MPISKKLTEAVRLSAFFLLALPACSPVKEADRSQRRRAVAETTATSKGASRLPASVGSSAPVGRKLAQESTSAKKNVASEVAAMIIDSRCPRQTLETIENWGITREWVRRPGDLDGGKIFASPTRKIGAWVQVAIYPDRSVEAVRMAPESTVVVNWSNSNCAAQVEPKMHPVAADPKKFRDADIQAMADRGESALIYAWSPHMPLSLKGYADAKRVAEKNGLKFVPVLDPGADEETAMESARGNQIPLESIRRADSVELSSRGMHLHYPSVLIFSKGKFGLLYPGLWERADILDSFVKGGLK